MKGLDVKTNSEQVCELNEENDELDQSRELVEANRYAAREKLRQRNNSC